MLKTQDEIHSLATKQATVLAMQQAALGRAQTTSNLALWKESPRLVEKLTVVKEWQYACELVLGDNLQAIVLDSIEEFWPTLKERPTASAIFLTSKTAHSSISRYPRLSEKVTGFLPEGLFSLDNIYTATDLDEALRWLPNLLDTESVITPDGYWLAKTWAKIGVPTHQQEQHGLLLRQEELLTLNESLALAQKQQSELKNTRDQLHEQLKEFEKHLEMAKQDLSKVRDDHKTCEVVINNKERSLQQVEARRNLLLIEQEELAIKLEELASEKEKAETSLALAIEAVNRYEEEQRNTSAQKSVWDDTLLSHHNALEEARTALHQNQLVYDREKLKSNSLRKI